MRWPSLQTLAARARGPTAGRWSAPWWLTVLVLLVAGVFLVLAFRGANWSEMWATARRGNAAYLALGWVLLSGSGFLRGLRWRVLLSAEKRLSAALTFWGTMAGYLGNYLLPARAGEVIRTVLIGRQAAISNSYVLATVLTERILDALALLVIGLLAVAALPQAPAALLAASRTLLLVVGASGLGLFILPAFGRVLLAWLAQVPLKPAWRERLVDISEQFLLGMRAFQHPQRALSFAGLTAAIWLSDALLALAVARAFDLALTLPQAVIFLAGLGMSSAAPSTPGNVGIFQFVAVTILVPFGFSQNQALVYILAFQMVSYMVVLPWGALGLWRLSRAAPAPNWEAMGEPQSAANTPGARGGPQ